MKYLLLLLVVTAIILLPKAGFIYKASDVEDVVSAGQVLTDHNASSIAQPAALSTTTSPFIPAIATWYDERHCLNCRPDLLMANGQRLDGDKLTAAYDGLSLGTKITIFYNGKMVEGVEITDRIGNDRIDLTLSAFKLLEDPKFGTINVTIIKE